MLKAPRRYSEHSDDCDCPPCYNDRMDWAAVLYLHTQMRMTEIAEQVHMEKTTLDSRLIRAGVKR